MKKLKFALTGALYLAVVTLALLGYRTATADPTAFGGKPDIVEVLTIDGEINDFTASNFADKVKGINESKIVKALVLRLDTPGGGAIASANLYDELGKLNVPVVVWCNSLCASGGMYAAMAPSVKFIGVRSETVAGSIGVIMHAMHYERLLNWARIDSEVYKSGLLKDSGNPERAPTQADRQYLQSQIDYLAERFYAVVDRARGDKIDAASWVKIKQARIFFGQQAVNVGLADAVIGYDEAVKKAKELSGSKLIFTRDEIKKMSAAANAEPSYKAPAPAIQANPYGDLPWLIELLKEIKGGTSIRFEYKMPYKY